MARSRLSPTIVVPSSLRRGSASQFCVFLSTIPRPPIPLSTLQATSRDAARKTEGQDGVAVSLLAGLFHSLQHAGLSRRTLINAASSTSRCNTIHSIDSTMLARENHLFGCPRSKPSQSSVPAGLALASDFGFCFQCQAGASLVSRRPIEITALIGHL